MDKKYYQLLKKQFSSKEAVLTEIINLSAICELPKATEHFMSDVHGEYDAFNHVLRNGSGTIRNKIEEVYGDKLTENEKLSFANSENSLFTENTVSKKENYKQKKSISVNDSGKRNVVVAACQNYNKFQYN